MNKFIKYCFIGLFTILISMSILDYVYTSIYEKSCPRTKFQFLRSLKDKQIDYLFIGSSRVENSIVPSLITKRTNKEVANLGFQAAKMIDIYTILQLVKKYNIHFEKIFIQIDYNYNLIGGNSAMFQYQMTPFVRENDINKVYSDNHSTNAFATYYVPFYRYCSNDLKIGFREVFANVINKRTRMVQQKGYEAMHGSSNDLGGGLPNTIIDSNRTFDNIKLFCKNNNIDVEYYTAPFSKSTKNIDFISKLKIKIPELQDFSGAIDDDKLFVNYSHLNNDGAKQFAKIFINKLLIK
ncbi:hypothetical protein [Flavobacterium sp. ACAM 123]|uniref:hypothetical protein n=1 Tax=Flavobacterium sp. ACAM 123 TaxID=1189620 RepID=UPI000302D0D4|nr:hypothetical protein [Flavobacterium sp. ACAM 123]